MHRVIRLFLGSLLLCCVASARAELVADPVDVVFPFVTLGFSSEPLYVSLRNTGNTSLSVVDLWSPDGGAFARAGGTCGTVPFTLAAQASCTLGYTFTPLFVGLVTQTLRATPDVGSFITFRLVGEGEVGGLQAGPTLFFGVHALGDTAGPLYMSLSNTSAMSLTVVSLTAASAPYARAGGTCGTLPFALAARTSCTLGYTFTPNFPTGEVYRDFTATSDVGARATFTLAGEGAVGSLRLDPVFTLYFNPPIPIGAVSEPKFVTLRNVGPVRMRVTAIAPAQVPSVQSFFRTGGTCDEPPFFLNAFASCTVGFTFVPAVAGETQLDMQFHHNVGSAESVTLIGYGLPGNEVFASGFEEL